MQAKNDPKLFLYKSVVGTDKSITSPTVLLSKNKKSVDYQLSTKFKNYSKALSSFDDDFLKDFSDFLIKNIETINEKISQISSDPPFYGYIVSFLFKDSISPDLLYPLNVESIKKAFLHLNKKGKGKEVICSVCGKSAISSGRRLSEMEIFKFSTMEKLGFLPAMNEKNTEKIIPICDECYKKIQVGSKIVNKDLNFPFFFKDRVWVIPKSIIANDEIIKTTIKILSRNETMSLKKEDVKRRSVFESRIFNRAKDLGDFIQMDFFFYRV